jgi:hypothetical protein
MVNLVKIGDAFPSEKALENYLNANPQKLEEGMAVLDQQYRFKSSTGVADLLCLDKEGQLVVVEVKILTAKSDSVMQLLGYLHEVDKDRQALFQEYQTRKKYRHMVDQRPRGIIVAPGISSEVTNALEFIKENTIELRKVVPIQIANTGTMEAVLEDVLKPDASPTQNPIQTEGDVIKNTRNTALQKISDEIIEFTRALGAPGEIITSVSPGRLVFKCSATLSTTKQVFLRLYVQKTQLKLEFKKDRLTQVKFATEKIISARGWDGDIKKTICNAYQMTQS